MFTEAISIRNMLKSIHAQAKSATYKNLQTRTKKQQQQAAANDDPEFWTFFFFCQYFDLEQILGYDCFHDISVFDRKWSSCIISKACYKPHTIFYSLPVKDSLVYTSWKLLVAVHCRSGKNNLCEQFIRLMEIPLYVTYFLERVSFILSWQKNTLKQL